MDFICIPLKQTKPTSFTGPLSQYIGQSYAEPPESYAEDLRLIDGMREAATLNFGIFTEDCSSFAERIVRYYGQLCLLFTKFPPNSIVEFSWNNSFEQESYINHSDLWFERASILFNIGATFSQAATQNFNIDKQGFVNAFKLFQKAAGAFNLLRTSVTTECRNELSSDMNSNSLNFLEKLMLAQAQECTFCKSISTNMKNANIAKVAVAASELYQECLDSGNSLSFSSNVYQPWKEEILFKIKYFSAVAQFRQAKDCLEKGKHGEEIARLQISFDIITALKTTYNNDSWWSKKMRPSFLKCLSTLEKTVSDNLQRSKYDNDIIYLHLIPEESSLSSISSFSIAKPEMPDILTNPEQYVDKKELGSALFKSLVPLVVHQAISLYEDRKENFVNFGIIVPLDELSAETLDSLNVVETIRSAKKPAGIPPQIILGADQIKSEGGLASLQKMYSQLSSDRQEIITNLIECSNILNEEARQDQLLRGSSQTNPDVVSRPASSEINVKYKSLLIQYNTAIEKAKANDSAISQKINDWKNFFYLLESGREQILLALPNLSSSDATQDPQHKTIISRLEEFLEEIEEMKQERLQKIEELKTYMGNDDITSELIHFVDKLFLEAKTPFIKIELDNFEPIFNDRLTSYTGFKKFLEDQRNKQHELLQNLKEANLAFISLRKSNNLIAKRQSALANLQKAIERFHEVSKSLKEGFEFYSSFRSKAQDLRQNCFDFMMARNLEAMEINPRLQVSSSSLKNSYTSPRISDPSVTISTTNTNVSSTLTPPTNNSQSPTASGTWNPSMPLKYNNKR
ncbi:hypothetical protein BB560_000439 [Smittium megazygosporum]|uniref:BRO domain-containing protein 1 n=1 Tax=Smittium megazygosporum TaxID=133381 RepID=A0A2T9ZKA4_9FUNG|nr:hypothetical protein BB560_000439 [Smittium megazygosporum]